MGAQIFPCIISALWSVGDLFSSIYGITSLKPKGKFIQPFPAFLYFRGLFIIFVFFIFFSFGLNSSLLFGWMDYLPASGSCFSAVQLSQTRAAFPGASNAQLR